MTLSIPGRSKSSISMEAGVVMAATPLVAWRLLDVGEDVGVGPAELNRGGCSQFAWSE